MARKTVETLFVLAHLEGEWAPCGRLTLTEEGPEVLASSFAYGLRYLDRSNSVEVDPVNLPLRDKASIRGKELQPANNLTLFGGIRDAAPDAWGRRVIEAKLKVPANSLPESAYLLHAGADRVGALDVRKAREDPPRPSLGQWESLQYLQEAAGRIEAGLPVPAGLEAIFDTGSAMGGARPKASVRDAAQLAWLAKFASHTDRFDIPAIEVATLRLARGAGLRVPPVRVVELGGRNIMLIRRFDRYWGAAQSPTPQAFEQTLSEAPPAPGKVEKRMPFVSGLTLLACEAADSPTKSYGDLAQAIRRYCHPRVIRDDNRELFARMVFNIFVSNDDDHLRNHGFVRDPQLPGWRLSPLYDVLPRPSLAHERLLHLGVGPQGRSATLDNAMAARELFTLSRHDAAHVIAQVWEKVREWKVYFEEFGVPETQIQAVAGAFRHIEDVASAQLRGVLP